MPQARSFRWTRVLPTHPSEVIEFTPSGQFARQYNIDAGAEAAFQIATVLAPRVTFNFAAVNDNNNSVAVYVLPTPLAASPHREHKAAPNLVGARGESCSQK
jgi:hypothetical protein